MRRLIIKLLSLVLGLAVALLAALAFAVTHQRLPATFWETWDQAQVTFDDHGVPTIVAKSWDEAVHAQGFVVASERMWQMDLIRRKAGGRLAEWFGEPAFAHDAAVQVEDRQALVRRDADLLPPEERRTCDLYAQGVNDFIAARPWHWGAEYLLQRVRPEPWTCADSLLVLFEMNEALTSSAEANSQAAAWKRHLSPGWRDFLFTQKHPWNHPYFASPGAQAQTQLPPPTEYLPVKALDPKTEARISFHHDEALIGSNNWAWRGPTGQFLANDPHLGLGVPGLWYAVRLRVSPTDWAVGVALPGLAGVVIGMNPNIAWSFTNTGEIVDSYLAERLSADGSQYLASVDGAGEHWQNVDKRSFPVMVHGESSPRLVDGQFTARGPLGKRHFLGDGFYSRQWLPLQPGRLRLPTLDINMARSLADFDQAIDKMTAPSQNALVMDRAGNMGYRMTGTGLRRTVSALAPQPALQGAWLGFEPQSQRRRLYYRDEGRSVRFLATANERVWDDPMGAMWASDDRKDRLVRVLASRQDFHREDMEALQLDTESRFRKLLLTWILEHAGTVPDAVEPRARWEAWRGDSRSDPRTFTDSDHAEVQLTKLLMARVRDAFIAGADHDVTYRHPLRRAWLTTLLLRQGDEGVAPFGLNATEVARFVLTRTLADTAAGPLHQEANRWHAQHPFVGRVPLVGELFRIDAPVQWGAGDVVLAEQPEFGPSMRIVWDMEHPWESTWALPVGESGHVTTEHFEDWHATWQTGPRSKVFPDRAAWGFPN